MRDHVGTVGCGSNRTNGKQTAAGWRLNGMLRLAAQFLVISSLCLSTPALAERRPHLRFIVHNNGLVMQWVGKITKPMSAEIATAFELNRWRVRAVELKLDSGGGSVKEGEEVIRVLQNIKKTHMLVTAVAAGGRCGSMCVFIFVQGDKRLAASASLWLFHEVSIVDRVSHTITRLDRARWEELVQKYWVPAGVNQDWINEVKAHTNETDYWQSGESLLRSKANLIHRALSDKKRRKIVPVEAGDARQPLRH